MKKIIRLSIILAMLFATTATAQQKSVWQRVYVGATYNQIYSQYGMYPFGSGFLRNHPSRALNTTASVRLWKRLEVGGYLSIMHCSPMGLMSFNDSFTSISWNNNDLNLTGGALVALHALPLGSDIGVDYVLRGGFGLNGETDGVWGGLGMEVRLARQLMATLYFDWGGFGFSNLVDIAEEVKPYRLSIGLKMNLK